MDIVAGSTRRLLSAANYINQRKLLSISIIGAILGVVYIALLGVYRSNHAIDAFWYLSI
jgi:hypothetical protein